MILKLHIAPYTLQLSLTKHEHTFTITSGEYYTYYDCDVCDLYYSEENACTHTSTATKGTSSATYFAQGYTGDTVCSRCGATISKGKSIKKKAPSLSSIGSSKKKQVSVYWTSVSSAKGYEIQYSTSKSMKSAKKVKVKKGASYSSTLKKLKSKKRPTM
ncbi:MAG: hypothetical protein LUG95_03855 [Clostridiales bacterium]|nr:hypothetical protein [Clostridiales bacterium]